MAILVPSLEEIKKNTPYPEAGELALIERLVEELDDSYEIFFQSYLNGLHPDIVILREGYGVFIIEVKDWVLEHYKYIDANYYNYDRNYKYGKMILSKNNCQIKNPFDQVMGYKDSLYKLYIHELTMANVLDNTNYGLINVGVYFHKERRNTVNEFFNSKCECTKYIYKFGYDSNIEGTVRNRLKVEKNLNVSIYENIRTLLTPLYHKANDGSSLKLTSKQKELAKSKAGLERKVKGIAGCGKSTILAHKAVNVVKRMNGNCRVLVLSYNITLKNYLRDKISAIREDFEWNNLNIIHFHGLINQISSQDIIDIKDECDSINWAELKLGQFKGKISYENQYDAILIDEGQDFLKEWFEILKQSFLRPQGEFFIMADEKQNIYSRELDKEKKVITNIKGAWNNLQESHRLEGKISEMALSFQKTFFKDKYDVDVIEQIAMVLDNQYIKYYYDENISYEDIFESVKKYADNNKIHFNNICIIADEITHLRTLEYNIRKKYSINSEIMFETQEEYDKVVSLSSRNIQEDLEKIRRTKKFGFNNNSGKLKICTTHSFKGWESENLILIIDKNDKHLTDELLYTAITRCKKNLIIFNRGEKKYDEYFKNNETVKKTNKETINMTVESNSKVIGIDLGTTNSIVSYMENGKIKQLKIGRSEVVPSAIFFDSKEQNIFGDKALKKMMTYPQCGIRLFKRMLNKAQSATSTVKKIEYLKKNRENIEINKRYVVDTNAFVSEPYLLKRFNNNEGVILSFTVLDELQFRSKEKETYYQATTTMEEILKFQKVNPFRIELAESNLSLLPEGAFKEAKTNNNSNDNSILTVAISKKNQGEEIILLTNDTGLQSKCESYGIAYENVQKFIINHPVREVLEDYIEISGEKASELFLNYLRGEASKKLDENITKAVITVPANFNQVEVEATKRAALAAGFVEVKTLKEPIAATVVYGLEGKKNNKILVYDFGGGTFDVSILNSKVNGDLEVLATGGNAHLGGEDITEALIEFIYDMIYDEYELSMNSFEESNLSAEQYRYNSNTIYEIADKVKKDLSVSNEENISIINLNIGEEKPVTYSFTITKKEFEDDILRDISRKAINAMTRCMQQAKLNVDDIDIVVLAGGTSLIPMLQEDVKNYFGKSLNSEKDLATIVSQGAALRAEAIWNSNSITDTPIIYDKTVHDFGVQLNGYKFDCLINSGVTLPVKVAKSYIPAETGQDSVKISAFVRQSGSEELKVFDDSIEYLDEIKIDGLPKLSNKNININVEFNIDEEYILSINAKVTDNLGNLISCENLKINRESDI